ncbi:MAG TPA: CAP domain-containing protein [Nonomuraea sp.]|nr:CAP domain-containing protein [Nonomuraea sp.]
MTTTDPRARDPRRTTLLAVLGTIAIVGILAALFLSLRPGGLAGAVASIRRGLSADSGQLAQLGAAREDLELPAIEAVNGARAARGLPPVTADGLLGQVARSRSQDMAIRHYFEHVTPDGKDIFGILDENGYPWATAGENLYLSPSRDGAAVQQAIEFWSTSPTHAANLFSGSFSEAGIGVAEGDEGVYLTLVLGQRF